MVLINVGGPIDRCGRPGPGEGASGGDDLPPGHRVRHTHALGCHSALGARSTTEALATAAIASAGPSTRWASSMRPSPPDAASTQVAVIAAVVVVVELAALARGTGWGRRGRTDLRGPRRRSPEARADDQPESSPAVQHMTTKEQLSPWPSAVIKESSAAGADVVSVDMLVAVPAPPNPISGCGRRPPRRHYRRHGNVAGERVPGEPIRHSVAPFGSLQQNAVGQHGDEYGCGTAGQQWR
jgi:hypothetical protein